MKKIATLILAAGMVFGAATGASAIDFKAKGNWTMGFEYGQGGNFMRESRSGRTVSGWGKGNQDEFEAQQRVRLQLDAVASEALSGTVYFEIGTQRWGRGTDGAALGTDGFQVKVRRAYLDWIVPNTELKVRMGLQGIALPSFAMGKDGSSIFNEDVAGIVLSNKFNDNFTLTAFWARPYNDNFNGFSDTTHTNSQSFMDNADYFGLTLPMTFDGFKITPFAMVGAVGPNVWTGSGSIPKTAYQGEAMSLLGYRTSVTNSSDFTAFRQGMLPAAMALKSNKSYRPTEYSVPFWLGVGGEITAADPFRFAWDVNYGNNGMTEDEELKRSGWFATILAEYKMDWGTPGLYAWYSTGDDDNVKNGSERMPTFGSNQGTNEYSYFAGNASPQFLREAMIGKTFIGTWGIGARLKDVSFLEGLKHTFAVNYYNGTNSPKMAKYILGDNYDHYGTYRRISRQVDDFNGTEGQGLYLTTQDHALEFNLANTYKIYDNLTLFAEASYIALWLDQSRSVWGANSSRNFSNRGYNTGGVDVQDAWNISVAFMYDF